MTTTTLMREDITILGGPQATLSDITPHAMAVLVDICAKAGVERVTISSTRRPAGEQARVMYDNCVKHGPKAQRALYGPAGDMVIDVFVRCKENGQPSAATIEEMKAKIEEIGPYRVSHHAADPKRDGLCVFDIAPSSIPAEKQSLFLNAARSDGRVKRLLTPDNHDSALHLEISEPKA